ncbi:MAG TPA: membrane protein insertion efficiency factor YidD [bacterium]|nr:MAG: putative membrane protein insertion efficiency factor [bacterium ADurb.Bin236]HOC93614.1 membrane protein insertion efficiency factor YidD [bacterium]HOY63688.1 membrane protein insertion efficiency factor YidD [bacterium]HPI76828.1 membrane protein insertion efficiency factor YidD [bacterium]HPN95238.1 membrane protein insertion efficiency factor YidD [bacterium]
MLARIAIFVLKIYKKRISPLLPPACRYTPTCSEYAMDALREYGFIRGGAMAAWRLIRCNPFARGGYDPVPPRAACDKELTNPDKAAI